MKNDETNIEKWPRVTRARVQAYAHMCVSVCISDHVKEEQVEREADRGRGG